MLKLISIFSFLLLFYSITIAQPAVYIELVVTETTFEDTLAVGLDLAATNCLDPFEPEAPPFPPAGAFYFVFDLGEPPTLCGAFLTWTDYRNAPSFPFTGSATHNLSWQRSTPGTTINIQYNLPTGAVMTIQDKITGTLFTTGPLTGSGTTSIPGTGIPATLTSAHIVMNYTDVGPSGPEPNFIIAPPSLNFGPVGVGLSSTLQATVSNPGTDPLTISNITSTDGQFTFVPNTFPITIPTGGNQIFDITFSPASLGAFPANIVFTHDGVNVGSPFNYPVQGVGADAGPTFAVDPTSLTFSTILVGNSDTKILTVTNNGLSNTLNISSVTTTNPDYTVLPPNATVAPGANQVFNVTFAPSAAGPSSGDVVFNHNGPGPSTSVPVTGAGFVPAAKFGLVFEQDTAYVDENTSDIVEKIQLLDMVPGTELHALQFRLITNIPDSGDATILTYQSIEKGSNISSLSNWILETNVVRGPITPNGASRDTIYVLLYNINNTGDLTASNYDDLLRIKYRTAVLPPLAVSQKSSFNIFYAEGSNLAGNLIDITPSDPVLEVVVTAAGGGAGDVNGDGCVDILDLIMVVDHIVGRDSLTGGEFDRADVAPWVTGDPLPTGDNLVNVQDLSVIQNIILTGFYPSGDPVTPCGYLAKSDGPSDATVTIYINSEGITAYVDAEIGIRGAQIEFSSVSEDPENMVISTPLGQGYYQRVNELLRTLMYDRAGQKYIDAGVNNFMADMPFILSNPNDVSIAKIVLVDINTRKMSNIEIQTIYGTPVLPLDYILFQNYPNPFNPGTSVQFQVPKTSDVTVTIYDMLGQEVRTLFSGEVMRGTYTAQWDGRNDAGVQMSSGSYIYRMIAGDFVQSKKMVLVK
jgi:hypothetical protein